MLEQEQAFFRQFPDAKLAQERLNHPHHFQATYAEPQPAFECYDVPKTYPAVYHYPEPVAVYAYSEPMDSPIHTTPPPYASQMQLNYEYATISAESSPASAATVPSSRPWPEQRYTNEFSSPEDYSVRHS